MATTYTVTSDINVDDIGAGAWVNGDVLVINNGAVVTVNTNQTKFWQKITVNDGRFLITNPSTTNIIKFLMGITSGNAAVHNVLPANALGTIEIKGQWIELGVGTGAPQDFTLNGSLAFIPAIFVETGAGTGVFEPWLNANHTYAPNFQMPFRRSGLDGLSPGVRGKFFMQDALTTLQAETSTSSDMWLGTVHFGVKNCNTIPVGARVRVPNIILTEGTPVNYTVYKTLAISIRNSGYYQMTFNSGGNLDVDICSFDYFYIDGTNATSISLKNCGFAIPPVLSHCYDLTVDNVGITIEPMRMGFYNGRWYTTDYRWYRFEWDLISGASIKNLFVWAYGPANSSTATYGLTFSHSSNLTIENVFLFYSNVYPLTDTSTAFSYFSLYRVSNSSIKNVKCFPLRLRLYQCTQCVIDGVVGAEGCLNETHNLPMAASVGAGFRFPINPITGEVWEAGVPVYFKMRSYAEFTDIEHYYDSPIIPSVTPYVGYNGATGESHAVYFGAALKVVTAAWKIQVYWSPSQGGYAVPFNKVEVYRSAVFGELGTQVYTTSSTSTSTYTDTPPAQGTTYYYTLRFYSTATVYKDSAQQIVIVPDYVPTDVNLGGVGNLLSYGENFSNAVWVKTSATVSGYMSTIRQYLTDYGTTGFYFSAATGTISRSITTVIGQTYTLSGYFASLLAEGQVKNEVRMTFGTATMLLQPDLVWKRSSLTFTATATTTTITFAATSNTFLDTVLRTMFACYLQVNVGDVPLFPVYTTVTTGVPQRPSADLSSIVTFTKDGVRGIEVIPTVAASNVFSANWFELFVGMTPDFEPSIHNMIASSHATRTSMLNFNGSNYCTVKNLSKEGGVCGAVAATSYGRSVITFELGCSNNKLIDVDYHVGGCGRYYFNSIDPNNSNNVLHGLNLSWLHQALESNVLQSSYENSNFLIQNVRANYGDVVFCAELQGTIFKGIPGGYTLKLGAGSGSLPFDDAYAGVLTSTNKILNTMFAELYWTQNTGALFLMMTKCVGSYIHYDILAGTPRFDGAGKLYMTKAGDSIEFKWPHRILGVSGFKNQDPIIAQNMLGFNYTAASYVPYIHAIAHGLTKEYSISFDNATWSTYKAFTGANLSAETLDATAGFYLKIRLTTRPHFEFNIGLDAFWQGTPVGRTVKNADGTATAVLDEVIYETGSNYGVAIVSEVTGVWETNAYVYDVEAPATRVAVLLGVAPYSGLMPCPSSYIAGILMPTTIDQSVTYPLATPTLTLTGLKPGSEVRIFRASNNAELAGIENSGTTFAATYEYTGDIDVTIVILALGYQWLSVDYTLTAEDATIPIQQVVDRVYLNA